jgi:SSU ribosomal protein S17P
METRNLRKERTGVVLSNKMEKASQLLLNGRKNTPFTESSLTRRRSTTLMTKITNVQSAIL